MDRQDDVWPVLDAVAGDLILEQHLPAAFVRLAIPAWRNSIGFWTHTKASLLELVMSDDYWRAVRLDPLILSKVRSKALAMYLDSDPVKPAVATPVAPHKPKEEIFELTPPAPKPKLGKAPKVKIVDPTSSPPLPSTAASPTPECLPPSISAIDPSASLAAHPPMALVSSTQKRAGASEDHSEENSRGTETNAKPRKRVRDLVPEAPDIASMDEEKLKKMILAAVEKVNVAAVSKLLPHVTKAVKEECLHVAVQEMNTGPGMDLITALLDAGVFIDALDKRGRTPLNLAICRRSCRAAALLLARGANYLLPQNSYYGDQALHTAALYDDLITMRLLLSYGVDPRVKNGSGATPVQRMKEWKSARGQDTYHTLHAAVSYHSMSVTHLVTWDVPCRSTRALVCRYKVTAASDLFVICAASRIDMSTALPDEHRLAPLRKQLIAENRVHSDGFLFKDLLLWSEQEVSEILLAETKPTYAPLQLAAASYPPGRLDVVKRVFDAVTEEENALLRDGAADVSGTQKRTSLKEHAYGEIKFRGIVLLSSLVTEPAKDHFFDLGSGRGLACMLISALTQCCSTGIEMEKGRAAFADRVLARLPELKHRVTLVCGDFLAADTDLSQATVVFINNHNMEFIEASLCIKLLQLKDGAKVVAVDPLPRDQENWDLLPNSVHCDGAEGEFYSYGNRLERYARSTRIQLQVIVRHAGRASTSPRKLGRRTAIIAQQSIALHAEEGLDFRHYH